MTRRPVEFTHARRRRLLDAEGVWWEAFEHVPAYDRRGRPTLVFMSDERFRRIRSYPTDWYDLPDAELLALSWHE